MAAGLDPRQSALTVSLCFLCVLGLWVSGSSEGILSPWPCLPSAHSPPPSALPLQGPSIAPICSVELSPLPHHGHLPIHMPDKGGGVPEPRSPCTRAFEQLWELLQSLVHSCCGSAHSLCWPSPHLQRPSPALSHTSLGGSLSREGSGEVGVGLRWSLQLTAGAHVGPWAAEPIPTAPRPAWQSRRGCPT